MTGKNENVRKLSVAATWVPHYARSKMKQIRWTQHWFWLILLLLGAASCRSSRSTNGITVANLSPTALHNVLITAHDQVLVSIPYLASQETATTQRHSGPLPQSVHVSWQQQETHSQTVQIQPAAPNDFQGRIYYQIKSPDDIRVFLLPATSAQNHSMPWGKPESWEGSISLPGMSGE